MIVGKTRGGVGAGSTHPAMQGLQSPDPKTTKQLLEEVEAKITEYRQDKENAVRGMEQKN